MELLNIAEKLHNFLEFENLKHLMEFKRESKRCKRGREPANRGQRSRPVTEMK